MAADAAAADEAREQAEAEALNEEQAEADPYQIETEDGETVQLMTEDEFFRDLFCPVFDGPQALDEAFRHIAIDNGDPARPGHAEATSRKLYLFLRNSAGKWLRRLLYADGTGLAWALELLPVALFAMGTLRGGARAMAEIRARSEFAQGEESAPTEAAAAPSFTTVEGGAHG